MIKHLLILREEMGAFKVEYTITEIGLDFSRTKNAAYELLKKRSKIFSLGSNNSFLEFFFQVRMRVQSWLKCLCALYHNLWCV